MTWPRSIRLVLPLALALGLLTGPSAPSGPHGPTVAAASESAAAPAPRAQPAEAARPNPEALAEFFNRLVPEQLARRQIPGAAVAVVQDGELAFARGYGLADLDRQAPVVADRTLFHIGSNAKLLTWTAVMQLVERGELDLEADVNRYLDLHVPATYPEPITLERLLAHTAGFENRDFGWLAPGPDEVTPLGPWLAANLPARVRPPGQEAGYSNYGAALAGYIVERVSGLAYSDYVEQRILRPLQMERSTVRQVVPERLAPDASKGYLVTPDGFQEQPLYTYQGLPAGTVRATATDVARFMLAHLQDGRYGQARLLAEPTARQMRQTLFRPDPRLNGLAYGFLELDRNGQRVVGHYGSAAPVHYSLLALLPDEGVGLFVAYNADSARPLTIGNETIAAFLDHFYPASSAAPLVARPDFATRAEQFTGEYQRNNFGGSYTTVEKIGRVLGGPTNRQVRNPGDGTLEVASGLFGTQRFVEVEPDLFGEVDGQERLLFRRDRQGRVVEAFISGEPEYAFERLSLADQPGFNQLLLLASVALFLSALLAAAGGWLLGRRGPARTEEPLGRLARRVAVGAAGVSLLFLVGLLLALGDPAPLMGDYSRLRALLLLPLFGSALSVGTLLLALLAWRRRLWRRPARLHYTAVALGGLGFTWFLIHWNLLGYHF